MHLNSQWFWNGVPGETIYFQGRCVTNMLKLPQHHPAESVRSTTLRLRTPLPQDSKMLRKRRVFQEQVVTGAKKPIANACRSLSKRNMRPILHGSKPRRVHLSSG